MQETDVLQFTGDRELKAYIYQQLMDIQPFLASDSQLAVLVQPAEPEDERTVALETADSEISQDQEGEVVVTLVVTFEEGRLETEGQAEDIYEAFIIAKERMVDQLAEWQNAMISSQERALQIQSIVSGNYMIH